MKFKHILLVLTVVISNIGLGMDETETITTNPTLPDITQGYNQAIIIYREDNPTTKDEKELSQIVSSLGLESNICNVEINNNREYVCLNYTYNDIEENAVIYHLFANSDLEKAIKKQKSYLNWQGSVPGFFNNMFSKLWDYKKWNYFYKNTNIKILTGNHAIGSQYCKNKIIEALKTSDKLTEEELSKTKFYFTFEPDTRKFHSDFYGKLFMLWQGKLFLAKRHTDDGWHTEPNESDLVHAAFEIIEIYSQGDQDIKDLASTTISGTISSSNNDQLSRTWIGNNYGKLFLIFLAIGSGYAFNINGFQDFCKKTFQRFLAKQKSETIADFLIGQKIDSNSLIEESYIEKEKITNQIPATNSDQAGQ